MRKLIIQALGFCYLAAFVSFYAQIDGLIGPCGLEPAHARRDMPLSLLSLLPQGKNVYLFIELLTVIGIVLSLLVSAGISRHPAILLMLFAAYHSCISGSTFYSFQWDILLLEAGFAAVLLVWMPRKYYVSCLLLLRFILFKLMLMSGVVKILSKCPTWLNLTACHYHFASQCLPTPLAWFFHSLPSQLLRLMTAATFIIEIPSTILILSPSSGARSLAFLLQAFLQINIMMTGNYTYFNLLTLVLCLSLLYKKQKAINESWIPLIFSILLVMYFSSLLFRTTDKGIELAMSPSELQAWADIIIPAACLIWMIVLLINSIQGIITAYSQEGIGGSVMLTVKSVLVFITFIASVPPFFSVTSQPWIELRIMPVQIITSYASPFHIASSYGLFRTMTGVGDDGVGGRVARPELEVLGSTDGREWRALKFRYKPGPLDKAPPWVAPYQPRLDWQMWFAALGGPNHSPWLLHLLVRLMEGHPSDLEAIAPLLDPSSPFLSPGSGLKYIRVDLYAYDFSPASWGRPRQRDQLQDQFPSSTRDWWVRSKTGVWMQPMSLESSSQIRSALAHHLQWNKTRSGPEKSKVPGSSTYSSIRSYIRWHPVESLWMAFTLAVVLAAGNKVVVNARSETQPWDFAKIPTSTASSKDAKEKSE